MSLDGATVDEWSRRHGGYDPRRSRLLLGWLRLVHTLARPLSRRGVSPDAVTAAAVLAAAGATRMPARAAAVAVGASVVLDGLDGAVAMQRGVDSAWGTVVDHVADRCSDCLFAVALRRAGAPKGLCTAAALSAVGFETLRGALRLAGSGDVARATWGDRPTRVAAVVLGLVAFPTAGAAAVTTVSVVGVGQLVREQATARRRSA